MTGVDSEVARAALVVGLVITALIYQRTRVASGGAVTGSFLALMVLGGYWDTIAGWVVLSLVGYAAITVAARTLPLPRAWLFAIGVITPAVVHAIGVSVAGAPALTHLSAYLAAGLYITNGLTAYDAKRQGIGKTFLAVIITTLATLAIVWPVSWAMDRFVSEPQVLSAIVLENPVVVVITLLVALGVRLGLRWGTAGIIGSLYIVDILSISSIAVILGFTLVGTLIYSAVSERLGLTPRERLYSLLAVGSIVAWFGLFWAEWLGLPGAAEANQFGFEPLLVIGLMIGETQRFGLWRMLAGSTIVTTVVWGSETLIDLFPAGQWIALGGALVISAGLYAMGIIRMRAEWVSAIQGGDQWGRQPVPPATEKQSDQA
jgi:hypothetical protein